MRIKTILVTALVGTAIGANYFIRPMAAEYQNMICARDHQRQKCAGNLTPSVNHHNMLSDYWQSGPGGMVTYVPVLPAMMAGISDHNESFHAPCVRVKK